MLGTPRFRVLEITRRTTGAIIWHWPWLFQQSLCPQMERHSADGSLGLKAETAVIKLRAVRYKVSVLSSLYRASACWIEESNTPASRRLRRIL
jgi:hypothetical protein